MRVHIDLDARLVAAIDEAAGKRGRSEYIRRAVRLVLDDERRWRLIESAFGAISDTGHDWDDDPAAWVAAQRSSDPKRTG